MRSIAPLLLLVALCFRGAVLSADAPARTLSIAVQWRTTTLPLACRPAVLNEAGAIWRAHGVEIRWDAASAGLTLRVHDEAAGTPGSAQTLALGWVLFQDGRPDRLLHASASAARRLVLDVRLGGRSLLDVPIVARDALIARAVGRAAAHEIGHYLLASPAHTPHGLMRATFTPQEIGSHERAPFALDPEQKERLKEAAW